MLLILKVLLFKIDLSWHSIIGYQYRNIIVPIALIIHVVLNGCQKPLAISYDYCAYTLASQFIRNISSPVYSCNYAISRPYGWQCINNYHNAYNHVDTGEELQLLFTSNKMWKEKWSQWLWLWQGGWCQDGAKKKKNIQRVKMAYWYERSSQNGQTGLCQHKFTIYQITTIYNIGEQKNHFGMHNI